MLKKPEIQRVVLVVDDDPAMVRLCERVLQQAAYRVFTANDGAAALRTMALSAVDLVLLDVFMPEKDGFETLNALRRHHPKIPVIAMSGGGFVTTPDDVLAQCRKLGVNGLLAKPFTDTELVRAVTDTFGARRIG